MIAYSINLPSDVQTQIDSAAAQYSVDAFVASAVAQVSSGGQQFLANGSLVITPFGVGIMGIGKNVATALSLDATQQVQNIQAGVATLSILLSAFAGNYPLALAAYITSVATVQQFGGIPPLAQVSDFVYNVSVIAANAGSTNVSSLYKIRNDGNVNLTF
jgi:soluble lytic murein transglycosylase-like protein